MTSTNPYEPPKTQSQAEPSPRNVEFDQVLFEIRREAGNATLAGVLGIFIWIIAPLAIVNGRRTLRLIDRHQRGFEFETKARLAIKLGYTGICLFALSIILVFGAGGFFVYVWSLPD